MFKRLCLLLAALVLPGLLLPGGASDAAVTPLPSDPTTGTGWAGLPDLDRSSGRFLSVSGNNNFTLPGDSEAGARNIVRLSFDAATLTQIRIALFDGGTRGRWDQRVDGQFVAHQPDTAYSLYADPDNTVAQALINDLPPPPLLPVPLLTVNALDPTLVSEDETWCTLYDQPIASPLNLLAYNAAENRYHFVLTTTLKASPSGPLSGYEINGYKLAFNGTYAIPANSVVGFTCGVVDGLELQSGETVLVSNDPFPDILPLGAGDGIVNSYDGTLELPFSSSVTCADLQIFEADSDWNRALAPGEDFDPSPTGVPPDSGIRYLNPQPPVGLRNAGAFAITGNMTNVPRPATPGLSNRFVSAIGYQVIRPDGSTFTTDEFTVLGHPSVTNVGANGPDTPFVKTTIPQSELAAAVGLWKFRWVGLDAHNAVFIKFNSDFGTTDRRVPVEGRVFCDEDGDDLYDVGEELLADFELELTVLGLPGSTKVKTDVNGVWKTVLRPGSYTIAVLTSICFPAKFELPFTVQVTGCEERVELLFPYDCVGDASGVVFCDSDVLRGVFDPTDDPFDFASIVVLERLEGLVVVETREVAVAAGVGVWTATGLNAGSWRASIKSDPLIDPLVKSTTQPVLFTIDSTHCTAEDINFGYICEVELCGRLFCDKDGDCLFDPRGDEPLGGVTVTATLTPPGGVPAPTVLVKITDSQGEFCFKVANGSWVIAIDPLQPALLGTTLKGAPANPIVVAGQSIKNLLFCYECFGRICGTVYLNKPDCDGDYDLVTDVPLNGIEVNLWKVPSGPPALPLRQVSTGVDGRYCFLDLAEGSYLVSVAGGQPELATLFATQPVQRAPVLLRGDNVDDQDFGYCAKARILGKVFRENGSNDCDGIYQADDTPIAGVTVQLVGILPVRLPVLDVTDLSGDYDFPNLEPGTYEVRVNGAQPQLIVLAPGSALTVPVTLLSGDETRVDFPFCPSKVCGTVYTNGPADCDEDYDLGFDVPLAGVVVNLWKGPAGPPAPPLRTAVTDLAGGYCFLDLDAGTYRLQVGANQAVLLNLTATQPVVRNPVVAPGSEVLRQDFGYCQPGRIRGRVFRESDKDLNCDGVFNGTDRPISGVTVSLVGTNPVRPPQAVLTDVNGFYEFPNLPAGEYAVTVAGGQSQLVTLAPGSAATVPATILGGDTVVIDYPFCPGRICGTVYRNGPGDCDEDYDLGFDVPLAGVVVNLWKAPAGPPALPMRTALTDLAGGYCFVDLDAGTYRLQVGANQAVLLNLTATQPVVRNPVLLPGSEVLEQDFGYCQPGRIRGRVFRESDKDLNCDGVFNGTDRPISGVTVSLVGTNPVRPPQLVLTDVNGLYEFPNLPAGTYAVTVSSGQPQLVTLAPGSAATVPATILGGDTVVIDYPFCPGRICGTVYKNDPQDCDENYDLGADIPLAGVTVVLWKAPAGPPALPLRSTVTGIDGGYCFVDLDGGAYRVQVGAGQPQLVNLTPTQPVVRNPVVLPGSEVLQQDFGYCEPLGRIYGYVFLNPSCTCDGTFDRGDTPLAGVPVALTRFVGDQAFLLETTSNASGFYEFTGLPGGQYTVAVDGTSPVVVDLSPSTPVSVGPFVLPTGGERRVDFGYCTQKVCGYVFREPPCDCDGRRGRSDLPAEGVLVQLLKLDAPNVGAVREALTDAKGAYCFQNVPPGRYELSVPEGQGVLAELEASTDKVRTVSVVNGCCRFDLDFGFCMPGTQRICVKVFGEPSGCCDGHFQAGKDALMPWVEVSVAKASKPGEALATGFTDAQGKVCFEGLKEGQYVVFIDDAQAPLKGFKPSTKGSVNVKLCPCEDVDVHFGFCRDCKPVPCCEGDLREVLVGTAFWVGDKVCDYDLTAKLYRGCGNKCDEVDAVARKWRKSFGGAAVGANEVLEVADVKVHQGVAYVVVRLKAVGTWFRDGVFGREPLKLKVTLNGKTFTGCATYRCESFRPSQYFDIGGGKVCVPKCDCPWRWDGRSTWDAPWICKPDSLHARFLVLDTHSQQEWECKQFVRSPVAAGN